MYYYIYKNLIPVLFASLWCDRLAPLSRGRGAENSVVFWGGRFGVSVQFELTGSQHDE